MQKVRTGTFRLSGIVGIAILLGGCGVPRFDLPAPNGVPTIASIVQRITCELTDLVRDGAQYQSVLIGRNYQVGVLLSLEVTDTGELTPNLNFPNYIYGQFSDKVLSWNVGARYSRSRTQNFSQNFFFSLHDLYEREKFSPGFADCPAADTNLAGELGMKKTVELALTGASSNTSASLNGTQGEFGGYVSFDVVRNLNSAGPTWKLEHFVGPGNLGRVQRSNQDKLTFGFAAGPGTKLSEKEKAAALQSQNSRLRDLIQQLLVNQISDNSVR